jgi:hypothetical protein
MIRSGCRTASIAIQKLMPDYTKHAEWLLGPSFYDEMKRMSKPVTGALNVLTHGDCQLNNMMFRNVNGQPVDVKLFDMQIFRYTPPSRDILYFLYVCTNHEFRQRHEAEVCRNY